MAETGAAQMTYLLVSGVPDPASEPWRSEGGTIFAINEFVTPGVVSPPLGSFADFICISPALFSFPSAWAGDWLVGAGAGAASVKWPPRYCFWLGLFGLALAAQSRVSFRQLNKVVYFIQGGCFRSSLMGTGTKKCPLKMASHL